MKILRSGKWSLFNYSISDMWIFFNQSTSTLIKSSCLPHFTALFIILTHQWTEAAGASDRILIHLCTFIKIKAEHCNTYLLQCNTLDQEQRTKANFLTSLVGLYQEKKTTSQIGFSPRWLASELGTGKKRKLYRAILKLANKAAVPKEWIHAIH